MTSAGDDKILLLLRHSKAEQTPGRADHERELTGRGRRDAEAVGAWLHEQGLGPELVLCSDATRTRQTWEHVQAGGGCGEAVDYRSDLYSGGTSAALQAIREDHRDAQVLMVVGHNPAIAVLASMLSEGNGSTAAHEVLASGFPTSTVAVLGYAGPWEDLGAGMAALERCHVCRG